MRLDNTSEQTRSNHLVETQPPHLRTSGLKVILDFQYTNMHTPEEINTPMAKDEFGQLLPFFTICDIVVQVQPLWNKKIQSDKTLLQYFNGGNSQSVVVNSYGVSFEFRGSGTFSFFDLFIMFNAVIQAIVLMGIPLTIARLLALHGVGIVSKIYTYALRQQFEVFKQFHGLSARMMTHAVSFRALTNQWETPVKELQSINSDYVENRMIESFKAEMDRSTDDGVEEAEVRQLTQVVLAGIDKSGEGEISYDEFLRAISANEFVTAKDMLAFFDEDRRPWPHQRCLDPTRAQIKNYKHEQIEATAVE